MTARMLLVLFLSTPLLAQHQAITAASAGERMRFTSPDTAAQIRVQILSIDGGVVFDSALSDGNVFDWPAEGAVNTLVNGSYRCLVTVRDLDGKVTEKEATVTSRDARLSMEGPSDASGEKVTLLAHDGSNGTLVSTAGDLSFRFGDFLAGKDVERMRLTADGELRVEGVIRASKGIVLPDGTILGAVSQPRAGA